MPFQELLTNKGIAIEKIFKLDEEGTILPITSQAAEQIWIAAGYMRPLARVSN